MLRPARVRRTCVRVRVVRPTWVVRLAGVVRAAGLRLTRLCLTRPARPVLGWLQWVLL